MIRYHHDTNLETPRIGRGEAASLDAICQQLALHRGHARPAYTQALDGLRERGFLDGPDEAEKAELAGLLGRLQKGLGESRAQ